jgi:ABC-2 type transport system ATP-binding protein
MTEELAVRTFGLTKQFERQTAVNNVTLDIASGEVYGLIGPNGAGKTTLIRMLAAAEEPTNGEIYISGERFRRGEANSHLKSKLGFLPDDFPLYDDLTVWDYLDYFARLYHLRGTRRIQRLHEAIELVSLGNKRDSTIATLSRGMKQRLSLARTIIHSPAILLLDEPVSGLDPIARVEFRNIIKGLQAEGMTVLISSHILSDLAEMCTSIGIMERGRMVESSRLHDLYERQGREQIVITALGEVSILASILRSQPLVANCEILDGINSVRIDFAGNLDDRATLLRLLIEAGIAITEFRRTQESLEAIFLKLGHQQTS